MKVITYMVILSLFAIANESCTDCRGVIREFKTLQCYNHEVFTAASVDIVTI